VHRPATIAGGVGDGSIFAAFVHVVYVERMWLHGHLLGEGVAGGPDPEAYRDGEAVAALWEQTSADWDAFVLARSDQDLCQPYTLPDGAAIPTWTVVLHAFNHTTHHVSEIWTALTAAGIQPPELSLMQWARQHDWA
jgi:uncharacterized damage-inducible protein DinB